MQSSDRKFQKVDLTTRGFFLFLEGGSRVTRKWLPCRFWSLLNLLTNDCGNHSLGVFFSWAILKGSCDLEILHKGGLYWGIVRRVWYFRSKNSYSDMLFWVSTVFDREGICSLCRAVAALRFQHNKNLQRPPGFLCGRCSHLVLLLKHVFEAKADDTVSGIHLIAVTGSSNRRWHDILVEWAHDLKVHVHCCWSDSVSRNLSRRPLVAFWILSPQ